MAAPPKAAAPKAPPNPLLNPAAPLQGQALQQAATSLTDAQTKGPFAELAKQLAFNQRQGAAAQSKTAGQFNQLGQYTKLGSAQETGIANDLNSQLQGIGTQGQQQLQHVGWEGLGGIVSHAPGQSNPALSPAVQGLSADIARQQANATNDATAFRSAGATQGANYRGLAAQNMSTYALKGQEALKGIAQASRLANEPIYQKQADLQASRGSLLATNEGKLRQQEIQNRVTAAGLGLNAKKLAATIAQNNATNSLKQAAINATLRGQDIQKRGQDLSHQDRQLANQLRALGMSFGGIASVLNKVNKARKSGNSSADRQALGAAKAGQGVQGVVGAVNNGPGGITLPQLF